MAHKQRLEELLEARSREGRFFGAAFIQQSEKAAFETVSGCVQGGWGIGNRVGTRFQIASFSKMFTAVGVLQLVEAGRLALGSGVDDLQDLQDTTIPREAAVYHLLTMTSGLADWIEASEDWEAQWAALSRKHPIYLQRSNLDYLPLFANKPPVAQFGAGHRYNNVGSILLGLVVKRLSGPSCFDYVRRHIFARAGMRRSDFVALDAIGEDVAEGYAPIQDEDEPIIGWKKNTCSATPEAAADGGAVSTVANLARFSQALPSEKLLWPVRTHDMLSPKVLESEERFRGYAWMYSYSCFFLLDDGGRVVRWGHTGEEDGVSCRLYHYPRLETDVAILGNQGRCAGNLAWEIHDLFEGA